MAIAIPRYARDVKKTTQPAVHQLPAQVRRFNFHVLDGRRRDLKTSSERTTKSASLPGVIDPFSLS